MLKAIYKKDIVARVLINFTIGALILGSLLPFFLNQGLVFYFTYLDETNYYKINSVQVVESKIYKPCDEFQLIFDRTSLITSKLEVDVYVQKTGDNKVYKIPTFWGQTEAGSKKIVTPLNLPCSMEAGNYRIKGSVEYNVNNLAKYEYFSTDSIQIKE
jgi:hypothetical protein